MTTISIEIEEPILRRLEEQARQEGRSTSEVIREVLLTHSEERPLAKGQEHFLDIPPLKLGRMLLPLGSRHEWYDEMLDRTDEVLRETNDDNNHN
ncbi:MAG: ribbon-helix-helix domain-containing protein [Planctomycetaceae bacterium]|nr:ribbon-helix-helix domain-containing protein [Planctomycetaceae bacterium]